MKENVRVRLEALGDDGQVMIPNDAGEGALVFLFKGDGECTAAARGIVNKLFAVRAFVNAMFGGDYREAKKFFTLAALEEEILKRESGEEDDPIAKFGEILGMALEDTFGGRGRMS